MEIDIRTLAVDPSNRATVYTGGSDGLFRSLDSGTTWANLMKFQLPAPNWAPPLSQPPPFGAEPAHTRAVLIHPANPSMIYALTWRYNACAFSDRLVFKSTDGGSTWSDHASPPFSGCRLSAMVLDPGNPETIYVAEAEDGAWLRKSADGGKNWNTVWDWTRGMESHLNALAIDPTNSAILYAGLSDFSQFLGSSTVSGLMKSVDGGATWSNLGLTGTAVTLLVVDPSDPSVIYASTEGLLSEPRGFRGLFKSTDSGVSWAAINDGLESLLDSRFRITDRLSIATIRDISMPGAAAAESSQALTAAPSGSHTIPDWPTSTFVRSLWPQATRRLCTQERRAEFSGSSTNSDRAPPPTGNSFQNFLRIALRLSRTVGASST
jgi:hypothetical protein